MEWQHLPLSPADNASVSIAATPHARWAALEEKGRLHFLGKAWAKPKNLLDLEAADGVFFAPKLKERVGTDLTRVKGNFTVGNHARIMTQGWLKGLDIV